MNNKLKYPNSLFYLSTYIGFPLLALILFIPWSVELDQLVTDYFYTHTHFRSSDFSSFLYRFGFYPAWVLAMMSFVILLLSFKFISLKKWRRGAIFLIAALAVGPGLFVHLVLKDHWGRPRPKQVIEYGGNQPFRPFYEPNFFQQSEPSKSFPCGHCSTGFYFFALAAVGRYYRKSSLYWLGLGLAIILGSLLSYARIAQGGHFLSDTLLSAFIIWLTTWGLYKLIFKNKSD